MLMPGAHLLVVVPGELDPARLGTPVRGVTVGAVNSDVRAGIDVEEPADGDVVARVRRHRGRQGRVVVDLHRVALGRSHDEVLVAPDQDRLGGKCAVEGDLGTRPAARDRLVECGIVGRTPVGGARPGTRAGDEQEEARQR